MWVCALRCSFWGGFILQGAAFGVGLCSRVGGLGWVYPPGWGFWGWFIPSSPAWGAPGGGLLPVCGIGRVEKAEKRIYLGAKMRFWGVDVAGCPTAFLS